MPEYEARIIELQKSQALQALGSGLAFCLSRFGERIGASPIASAAGVLPTWADR
jgi:hypothetical protein